MSDIPVLRTKITPPYRRDELLSRGRLIELFDDLLEKKLVIVTAPAGYGKTSLLVDLAHRHELPYCWYALDPLDKELGRFLTHFVSAIQLQFPQFGLQSIASLQNLVAAGDADSGERFLVTLVNELYQTIREHFAIVLDDYHNLDDNLEINAFISRFIQEVDQNCHLVILSRRLLPLPDLPLMVARSQVGGLGQQELAFRSDEIQALMLQNYQQSIPDKVAAELAQRTEGWITGLLLSAQTVWQGMLDRLRVARVSGVGLYDYLVHQVLEQQPPELQDFLLKSAYLEEFNAEICVDLMDNLPDGRQADSLTYKSPTGEQLQAMQSLVQTVLQLNLFVTAVGENGSWLRYHPLFREFLQDQLAKTRPETAHQVRVSLVRIYSQRGEWERAYAACQQLDDPSATAALLEQAARTMLSGGRISQFQKWLNALPPGLLESRPVLLGRYGLVLATQGETARGLGYLDQALTRFQSVDGIGDPVYNNGRAAPGIGPVAGIGDPGQREADPGQRDADPGYKRQEYDLQLGSIYLWRALVHQIRGSYATALEDTAAALALADRNGPARSPMTDGRSGLDFGWLRSEAYRLRGICERWLGRVDESIRNFSTALSLYQAQGNSKSVNLLLVNLGTAYLDAAEFGSALTCYKQALDYYQTQNDPFSLSSVLNELAYLHQLRGEYSQAFTTLEEALAKAEQGANLRVQALALTGMGDLHQDLQSLDTALDFYHRARPIVEQINDRYLMIYLDLAEASLARLKGDSGSARLLLSAAAQISQQGPSEYFHYLYQLESGKLALAEHDYSLAAEVLEQAAAGFVSGGQRVEAGRARLLLAAACYELGDLPAAERHLAEMFKLVDRWENQHCLVPTARLVRPFLQQVAASATSTVANPSGSATDPLMGRKALRLLDEIDRLDSNLARLQRGLRRQSSLVAPSPPHLQIRALGRDEVLLRARPNSGAKADAKPGAKASAKAPAKAPVGQPASADWQTQVTRDLFFLILSDPRGWTKEALGELLWPGSSSAQLKLRFKNTIYRLRRALQQDAILFEGDRYTFNRSLDYEYDVEQFWEQLNQASENATAKKKIKALQAALQIYQGDYLPEVSGAWVLAEQARLRQAFLDAGIRLARLLLESGQLDQALAVTNRLIETDPCLDEAYLTAMRVQSAAGNRPAVARLYEKLSQALLQELNASPSAQTEGLYQSLRE